MLSCQATQRSDVVGISVYRCSLSLFGDSAVHFITRVRRSPIRELRIEVATLARRRPSDANVTRGMNIRCGTTSSLHHSGGWAAETN
jgi:hypothetical protein